MNRCDVTTAFAGESTFMRWMIVGHLAGLRTRGLLSRRNISDGDLAFFATWCRPGRASRRSSFTRPAAN